MMIAAENIFRKHKKFILFCIVGGSSAIISVIVYNLAIYFGIYYLLAQTFAFIISVANGLFWNKKHVFKSSIKGTAFRFFALYCTTFALGQMMLWISVEVILIHKSLAQLIVIFINTFINYYICNLWVFRDNNKNRETTK